jgi:hypothetical protein
MNQKWTDFVQVLESNVTCFLQQTAILWYRKLYAKMVNILLNEILKLSLKRAQINMVFGESYRPPVIYDLLSPSLEV